MEFRTPVDIPRPSWTIAPCERMLFVGSCFADNVGRRFREDLFRAVVNPYGVMYNPASILHTVERLLREDAMPFTAEEDGTAVFTLGTNHVYVLKESGEVVDNCARRPATLFEERVMSVKACADYLRRAITLIHKHFPRVRFILTVSPIRYRKYGYHASRLSKATLLLAADDIARGRSPVPGAEVDYFPAYEIMDDELRDYRFYKPDMLHPSDQAVEYIHDRLAETYFAKETFDLLKTWKPLKEALGHRPFHPESEAYKEFRRRLGEELAAFREKYPMAELPERSGEDHRGEL